MVQIYDCFIFYNELNLLNMRLHELNSIVDKFVLVEATRTHTNNSKKLFYKENKDKFQKFNDKIIHIIVDLPNNESNSKNNWIRENFHRNCIIRGLNNINDNDIIILSDLDEIPKIEVLEEIKKKSLDKSYILGQRYYYYDFDKIVWNGYKNIPSEWKGTIVTLYKFLKKTTPQDLRNKQWNGLPVIKNGGSHCSYFGDNRFILNKIKSVVETPPNFSDKDYLDQNKFELRKQKNKSVMKKLNDHKQDLRDNDITIDKDLPKFYKIYYQKL